MLRKLQKEVREWSNKNFPDKKPHQPLIGIMEEIGELSHVRLKYEQELYQLPYYYQETKDGVADLFIFLLDYCNQVGIDFDDALKEGWEYIQTRNYETFKRSYARRQEHYLKL